MGKKIPNTKKGRENVPEKPGVYNLYGKDGKVKYTGRSDNLKRRIEEHYNDKDDHFSHFTTTPTQTNSKAKKLEKKRLSRNLPPENKIK